MNPNEQQIMAFLERYGRALSGGDLSTAVACWAIPALVVSDEGAVAISDPEQVEAFFGQAVHWYREQGVLATEPALEQAEALSDRLASVEVRWVAYDGDGAERWSELSIYILHLGDDGELRIRVALTRPDIE